MEKYFQPTWMQTVTCLTALKSDDDDDDEYLAHNLTKVLGEKRYLYAPVSNSSELDRVSSSLSQPAESGPFTPASGPGGLLLEPVSWRADFPPIEEDSSPLMKALCSLTSDAEAPSCVSQSTEVTDDSWVLRTLHQATFSANYLDPFVHEDDDTVGCRYLYAPPSATSGFEGECFPPCTHIHLDKWELEVSYLESEELVYCCIISEEENVLHPCDFLN